MTAPQMKIRELLPTRLMVRRSTWPCASEGAEEKGELVVQIKALVEKL